MKKFNYLELIDYVVKNGGVTISINNIDCYTLIENNSGYIVALDKEIQFDIKKDYYKLVKYFLSLNNGVCGLWLHEGVLYIDEELYFTYDKEDALKIGQKYNQKAIFDCTSQESIYL